ncbi:DUF5977 domain-containing protein [Mucilaginibacter sp. MD40]|uniref:DUF5977 domain-containing protein n=1 Tax=Mucilaginibacter sp. MD40 TaxID=2029590 RepID=UPI001180B1B6|nr:DUF5977 domain-containing protein [Mucilaginibacter sp. MD40]
MENYRVKMIPYSPVRIQNTAAHIGYDTAKFTITDTKGTIFRLGYQYREVTSTTTTSSRPSKDATTNWMLESMVSQNKHDTIRFTYQLQGIRLPEQTGQSLQVEDNETVDNTYGGGTYATNNWTAFASNVSSSVNEQDPKEIFFKNGKVVFKLSPSLRTDLPSGNSSYALDTILVYAYDFARKNYESRAQKTIIFKRSSFPVMSGGTARMRLDSVQILDKAQSLLQTYRFTYDSTPLPAYFSYSKDFWGYYNGKMDDPNMTNRTLIPRTKVDVNMGDAMGTIYSRYIGADDSTSRNPDTLKMQAGILKRIDYPTGGYTVFNFETNRYFYNGVTRFVGGLRIKSIQSFYGIGAIPVVRSFQYNSASPNFPSGGSFLGYGFFQSSVRVGRLRQSGGTGLIAAKTVRTFSSEAANAFTGADGNPLAYTNVTEYQGDLINNIGKSVYIYQSNSDLLSSATYSGTPVIDDYSHKRGHLLSKTDYVKLPNNTYQPVKSESYDYVAFADSTYDNVGVLIRQVRQCEDGNGVPQLYLLPNGASAGDDRNSYQPVGYAIKTGDSYPVSTTTKFYDQNDPSKFTSTTVEYKYDNFMHQQVSRTRTTDSKGNLKIAVNKYPADYIQINTATTGNSTLDAMLAANMQAEPIEKWDSVKNVTTSLNGVVSAQLDLYQSNSQTVLPASIKKLNIPSPITNFSPATVVSGNITSDSRYVQMIAFDNYAIGDNALLQYTSRNAGPTSVIWDYNGEYPSAQIKNAIYSTLTGNKASAYTSFETNNGGNWTYTAKPVTARYAPTGKLVFPLSQGNISANGFDLSKPHILSYWSDNGAANVYASSAVPGKALRTVNGWTLYRHDLPAAGAGINISISGSGNIDELKTYPADAQMNTYTFDADGLSAITDEKDQISKFEYDPSQRLQFARDWQNNIIKAYDYHNYDMTFGNDAIASTTFTRDNCPAGTSPQSTTYAIAANSFYSSSKASANALAQYYLQQEGQKRANDPAVCGCPIQYVTISFKDQTGLGTYQAVFSGASNVTYNIPSGNSTKQVPAGTYTLQINAVGTQSKNFSLTGYSTVTGRTATFNNVNVSAAGPALTLTIY